MGKREAKQISTSFDCKSRNIGSVSAKCPFGVNNWTYHFLAKRKRMAFVSQERETSVVAIYLGFFEKVHYGRRELRKGKMVVANEAHGR